MWINLLSEIKKIEEKYGGKLNTPATEKDIKMLRETVKDKFNNMLLPTEYLRFLEKINGIEFNGLVIYGVDDFLLDDTRDEEIYGFIETNEVWYENEWQKVYIFFGDSDISWYCLDLNNNVYLELDKPSGTIMNSFSDFDSMLLNALEERID